MIPGDTLFAMSMKANQGGFWRGYDSQGFRTGDGVRLVVILLACGLFLFWPLLAFGGTGLHGAYTWTTAAIWAEAGWAAFLGLLGGLAWLAHK